MVKFFASQSLDTNRTNLHELLRRERNCEAFPVNLFLICFLSPISCRIVTLSEFLASLSRGTRHLSLLTNPATFLSCLPIRSRSPSSACSRCRLHSFPQRRNATA